MTEADIAHYREHGHVTIRQLLPRADVERLVERLDGMLDGRYPSDGFVCGPASWETPDDPGRFILQVMATKFPINDPVLAALAGGCHADGLETRHRVPATGADQGGGRREDDPHAYRFRNARNSPAN